MIAGTRKCAERDRKTEWRGAARLWEKWSVALSDLAYYLRISNHLAGELDIRSALRAVKGEIDRIIDVDHLDVCLMDEEMVNNHSYEVGLHTSWSASRSLVSESPVRDILTGACDTMMTGNAPDDPRYMFPGAHSGPILQHALRSRINVAMKVLGHTIGALNCSSRRTDYYNADNLAQVQALADILSPYFFALRANETAKRSAIERTRIEAQQEGLRIGALHLTEALENERQRVGMDLHDQTLADLTRLARDLRPGLGRKETERLQQRINICIQGLRGIIDTSIPSILELFGFEEAVRSHFETASDPARPVSFVFRDDTGGMIDRLPDATRIALFRICQEAVNNSLKHAGAGRFCVTITTESDMGLKLTMQDDGSFRRTEPGRSGGLAHMRTRARLIGGRFTLTRIDGTAITVILPQTHEETELPDAHSAG